MKNCVRLIGFILFTWCVVAAAEAFAAEKSATPVTSIRARQGFQVELIRSASKAEGSWISMTFDNKGRLILGLDNLGLARLTLGKNRSDDKFEIVETTLKHCRGLLYAHGRLYVSATNSNGFYQLKDTTGDDHYNEIRLLKTLDYQSRFGHGGNQVVLGPDGMIYVVVGNDVPFPEGTSPRSAYRDPRNDHLLPNPHDGAEDQRVGYILRTDEDGTTWEIVAGGFRNQFDIAFNHEGEMFTHDADMEWDVGQPWYRPTRINHVVSGGEYGWRWGTGKWPEYFEDSLPSTLDTGLGSPTGMTFGIGSRFPDRFKNSLFTADWQNGRILLVDLIPDGASYSCQYEVFLEGTPLNVCDMQFGPDGALYFITGGRGSQSGLYRVTSTSNASQTKPEPELVPSTFESSQKSRKLRRWLETFHVRQDADVNQLWSHLNSEDRWLRYAARIAIENQPVSQWRERAVNETSPTAAIAGSIALCRQGQAADRDAVLKSLGRLDVNKLSQQQLLGLLRAWQLCFVRLGAPTEKQAADISEKLGAIYPHPTSSVNHLAGELLVYLNDKSVVVKTVELLKKGLTQEEQIRSARILVNAQHGWSHDLKQGILNWLVSARTFQGGKQLERRVLDIRDDFLKMLTDKERKDFGSEIVMLNKPTVEAITVPARPVVQQWKVDDISPHLGKLESGRSFQNARTALLAANCLKCHRIGTSGAQIGPDLSTVGKRFDNRTILESIITPSKVIDEKYLYSTYILSDGQVVTGRPVGVNKTIISIETDLLNPKTLDVLRSEIEETSLSTTSPMPGHLIDVLTRDEILDLLAYIKTGGDPNAAVFKLSDKGTGE